jgi:hypothetical protein
LFKEAPRCKINRLDKKQYCLCNPEDFPVISLFKSVYNKKKKDRQWTLQCGKVQGGILGKDIETGHESVNEWDKDMNWEGWKDGKFLTGIESKHSNRREDRKYYLFWAKSKQAWKLSGCSEWTQLNKAKENIDLVIPDRIIIGGLRSKHDNGPKDRVFKLKICDLTCTTGENPCERNSSAASTTSTTTTKTTTTLTTKTETTTTATTKTSSSATTSTTTSTTTTPKTTPETSPNIRPKTTLKTTLTTTVSTTTTTTTTIISPLIKTSTAALMSTITVSIVSNTNSKETRPTMTNATASTINTNTSTTSKITRTTTNRISTANFAILSTMDQRTITKATTTMRMLIRYKGKQGDINIYNSEVDIYA